MKKMTMSEVAYTLVSHDLDEKVKWSIWSNYEPDYMFLVCKECGETVAKFAGDTCTYNVVFEHDCFLRHAWSEPNFRKCVYMCTDKNCVCGDLVMYADLKDDIRSCENNGFSIDSEQDALKTLIAEQEELLARRKDLACIEWTIKEDRFGEEILCATKNFDEVLKYDVQYEGLCVKRELINIEDIPLVCKIALEGRLLCYGNIDTAYISDRIARLEDSLIEDRTQYLAWDTIKVR